MTDTTPTRADKHCALLDLSVLLGMVRLMPAGVRAAALRRWRYTGPHKSVEFCLGEDSIALIVQTIAEEETAAARQQAVGAVRRPSDGDTPGRPAALARNRQTPA